MHPKHTHTWAAAPIPCCSGSQCCVGLWGSRIAPRMLSPTALVLLLKDVVSSSAGSAGCSHPYIAYHCGTGAKLRHEHHQSQAYRVSLHLIKEEENSSQGLCFVVVESEARFYLSYTFPLLFKIHRPSSNNKWLQRASSTPLLCVLPSFCYCRTADTARAPSTPSYLRARCSQYGRPHLSLTSVL